MIHEHNANGRTWLIVQIPKNCISVGYDYILNQLSVMRQDERIKGIMLPDGTYTFLFVAEQATEEQAEMVVENEVCGITVGGVYTYGFVSYTNKANHWVFAKDSLSSLIRTLPDWQQYNHAILLKEN
jgi:hypothetical protein